jgi:methionyl-tRNA formyltransferase
MRLVMMGTGPFGVPTFRGLYDSRHTVAALVTRPLKERRPGAPISPMRDVAHEHRTPVFDPEDINSPQSQARLAEMAADLFVVCDYGQILSAAVLAMSRMGGINLHASLLPKYRGAAPINWAIYHGETETGVSVIHMTPRVDAGPIIAQAATPIQPDETSVELEARLSEIGGWLMVRAVDTLESGDAEALPQDPALASKAPRLKKTDGLIDWNRPASAIRNHVRAMEPWPKTYTYWHRASGPPVRLFVGPVTALPATSPGTAPGTVVEAARDRLVIAAGEGAILVRGVQPAGRRLLTVREFLNGHRVALGDRFGPE